MKKLWKKLLAYLERLLDVKIEEIKKKAETKPIEEVPKTETTEESVEKPVEKSDEKAADTADDLDLTTVSSGASKLAAAKMTAVISEAWTDGKNLHTKYSYSGWPTKNVSGVDCDAICHFFYRKDGAIVGGKYDWWRKGGQGTKGLENVHEGYQGHSMPAKGTDCWTMITSVDNKQRSNTEKVVWK